MQFAWPYQYRQKGSEVARTLGTANFALRILLSRVFPFLFSKPVALLVSITDNQDTAAYNTLYQDALTKAHRTTAMLYGLAVILLLCVTKLLTLW
jgi:hypothetical protein